jgi:tripartite-type tricarboxylate transporter receptor subunit TctC
VKALAVTAPKRAAVIPDVPSTTEAGLPDLQTIAWTALFVPKATPQPIVERINASVDKAVREETTAKRMADLGADLPPSDQRTPQALGTLVRSEIDKWVPLIKAAGAVGE